jgi:Cof subfamily protein (haloacid dehalogenase superfamily)
MADRRSAGGSDPAPIPLEARFPIRLLALDIDGTLVGDDLTLRSRTIAAVRGATARGVQVALATGRMSSSARGFAETLGLSGPVIAYQGALIREMSQLGRPLGRLLVHRPLSVEVARETLHWAADHGLDAHLNHLERLIMPFDDPRAEDYSRFLGARSELVPDLERWIRHPVTKVLAVGHDGSPARLMVEARADFAGRAEATVSHPDFLEFLAPGVSKGRAVRWLARRLRIPLEQTMAIGDQYNDLEMLATVGHGVAMPTAPTDVRAVARYLAPPVDDDGAAQMIEALILAGRAAPRNAAQMQIHERTAPRTPARTEAPG